MFLLLSAIPLSITGCASGNPAVVVGRANLYDYSPSVIQTGDLRQFWWCGQGVNPTFLDQVSDTILYESINVRTGASDGPHIVLAETYGAWDETFTCNPRVIRGSFNNPLGDGQTWTYALYYVATSHDDGEGNSIGVAFSNDGEVWKKYPTPILSPNNIQSYGYGQPVAYNNDGKSNITLFYEDLSTPFLKNVEATSTDGLHFTSIGNLTILGLDPKNANPSWGDMGYDPVTHYWYAGFQQGNRNPVTTGNIVEFCQYGIQLFRIPAASLLTGNTPWQLVTTFDTNSSGEECNFIPGFLKDGNGNINVGPYPTIQLYPSISDPQAAWNASPLAMAFAGGVIQWDIGSATWTPGQPPLTLNRYRNPSTYEVTTGWIDPNAHFQLDAVLGHLYHSPQNGATLPLYSCKAGSTDYFTSLDNNCTGQHIQGIQGYGYAAPVAGIPTVPLYSCSNGVTHFVSHDPQCETHGPGTLLGYALP